MQLNEYQYKYIILSLVFLIIGLVIGYLYVKQVNYDNEKSVDRVEYLINNIDEIPYISHRINNYTTLNDIKTMYNTKHPQARFGLSLLLRGICLE